MPEIMRQYGPAMVAAVTATLLMTMLFFAWPGSSTGSVVDDIGARSGQPLSERATTGVGTDGFKAHSGRSLPQARVNGPLVQGEESVLLDNFTVTDSDGAAWSPAAGRFVLEGTERAGSVRVSSITSSDGTEHLLGAGKGTAETDERVAYDPATGLASFALPGVYRVSLTTLDLDNVPASYTIPLVVDFALEDLEPGDGTLSAEGVVP